LVSAFYFLSARKSNFFEQTKNPLKLSLWKLTDFGKMWAKILVKIDKGAPKHLFQILSLNQHVYAIVSGIHSIHLY